MSRAYHNAPLVLGPASNPANNRRFGRVRCERLICSIDGDIKHHGVVLDLSAGGARLQFKGRPPCKEGDAGTIVIESETVPPFSVSMKVVWRKKRGFRRYEIGVTFGEPPAPVRAALASIMRSASVTNTVYREDVA